MAADTKTGDMKLNVLAALNAPGKGSPFDMPLPSPTPQPMTLKVHCRELDCDIRVGFGNQTSECRLCVWLAAVGLHVAYERDGCWWNGTS
jgi:hypothetical protein